MWWKISEFSSFGPLAETEREKAFCYRVPRRTHQVLSPDPAVVQRGDHGTSESAHAGPNVAPD